MDWDSFAPAITLLAASPGSGKSYCIRWMVYELFRRKKFDYGIVWSPTAHTGAYDYMPKNVYPIFTLKRSRASKDEPYEYRNEELDLVMEYQRKNPKSRAFLIFDDCLGSVKWQSQQMLNLITTYRHLRLTIFIATQYMYQIPPFIRECSKFAVIFDQVQRRSIKAVYETFFGTMEEHELRRWLEQYCQDYHFILVDMTKGKKGRYKVMKAGQVPRFKLSF